MALAPVSAMVWGYDQIRDFVVPKLEEKLKKVPEENIIIPDPIIAVPTIDSMRYTSHREELRNMYVNLLANSMDKSTNDTTHPSFVEVIKQLNSDEALIFQCLNSDKYFPILRVEEASADGYITTLNNFSSIPYKAYCANPELASSYLENLVRLGLINISYNSGLSNKESYNFLEQHPLIKKTKENIIKIGKTPKITKGYLKPTDFGKLFYDMCVKDKE